MTSRSSQAVLALQNRVHDLKHKMYPLIVMRRVPSARRALPQEPRRPESFRMASHISATSCRRRLERTDRIGSAHSRQVPVAPVEAELRTSREEYRGRQSIVYSGAWAPICPAHHDHDDFSRTSTDGRIDPNARIQQRHIAALLADVGPRHRGGTPCARPTVIDPCSTRIARRPLPPHIP